VLIKLGSSYYNNISKLILITLQLTLIMKNNHLENLIENIKQEIRNEHWYWHVVNLAWTAGPVTFIAVYAAYYIGYGEFTSIKTIIYFGLYTVFAGLFALAFQTVKNATINPKLTEFKYELYFVIDRLLAYIYFCREHHVISQHPNQRDMMSAWYVLSSSTSDITMVKHAVYLCTKQKDLAESIEQIEFFRKQGFSIQLKEEYDRIENSLNNVLNNIEPTFPSLAKTIRERFKGNVKNSKFGVERPQGFLSRIITAANEENGNEEDTYIRIEDAIALFNLTIELILNRKILTLHPEFNGEKEFEKLFREYETKISDFKLIRRLRNNKAKELLHLVNSHFKEIEFSTVGVNSAQLNRILKELKTSHKYKRLMRNEEVRKLFDEVNHKNKRLRNLLTRLKAIYAGKLKDANLSQKDISIDENYIFLEYREKIESVRALSTIIKKNGCENLDIECINKICFEIINILDDKLNISEHDEQIAIEESMAVDLNILEPNFTTAYKIELIVNQINELQDSKTKTIHRFVKHLIQYYHFDLSESFKQKIITEYQAEKECLDIFSETLEKFSHVSLDSLEKEIFRL